MVKVYIEFAKGSKKTWGEDADMRREHVDLLNAVWAIPAEDTKNGLEHVLPLSPTAKGIIERRIHSLPANESRVFPGLTLRALSSKRWASKRWVEEMAELFEWKDLRRTMATRAGKAGFDNSIIGLVLNRAQGRTTVAGRHYNRHDYMEKKREVLDWWDSEGRG